MISKKVACCVVRFYFSLRQLDHLIHVHLLYSTYQGGIVGLRKPRFLVWGADSVVANRMESLGVGQAVHLTQHVMDRYFYSFCHFYIYIPTYTVLPLFPSMVVYFVKSPHILFPRTSLTRLHNFPTIFFGYFCVPGSLSPQIFHSVA